MLVLAEDEARLLGHGFIGTEHLLLGVIRESDGLGAKAIESLGISPEAVREGVKATVGPVATASTPKPPFTPRAKKVLELSFREALQFGHNYIGTEHLLLGIVREGEGVAARVLLGLGADLARVREQVIRLVSGSSQQERPTQRRRDGFSGPEACRIGTRVTFEVVRAGRSAADSASAFETMAQILRGVGIDIDALEPEELTVESVETDDGPGLRLVVEHLIHLNAEQPSEDPGDGVPD